MNIEQLIQRIQDVENRLCELETNRSPDAMYRKLEFFGSIIEEHTDKIEEHEKRLNAADGDESIIEDVTNEDIIKWYEKSGLLFADVKAYMIKINKIYDDITDHDVAAFLRGEAGDKRTRAMLVRWFRTRAIKRNSELV